MKIVFLAPFGIRPKGTLIARMLPLAASLQELGHSVVIVAPPYTNPEDSGKVETVRGVKLVNVLLGPKHKALAAPFLAWRLFAAALAEKPDLVHLFKPKGYGGLAAMLQVACSQAGVRMPRIFMDTDDWEGKGGMNELHGYSSLEKKLYEFQERWIPRHCLGVTVASKTLQELTLGMGLDPGRVLYLPNCVDDVPPGDGRPVRQRLGIPAEAPVLLLYTRFFEFEQEKLHQIFVEVFRKVEGVRFLVVGRGRQGEEDLLRKAAEARGFASALVMAGWIEPVELPDYLAVGDVALYPFTDNLVNRTKCPAKLTELLRAGVPVVGDRVGQIPEYLVPQLHDQLCDPGNPAEMAAKCAQLLLDPERRRKASAAGRDFILSSFTWRGAATALNDFYQKCDPSTRGL